MKYSRWQIVSFIEKLTAAKKYKIETLYTAVSIVDRYLVYIAVNEQEAPCLITLAITSLLIAAKLE